MTTEEKTRIRYAKIFGWCVEDNCNKRATQRQRCKECDTKEFHEAFARRQHAWDFDRMMGGGKGPEHNRFGYRL